MQEMTSKNNLQDWKTNSTSFAEMLINGLMPIYAKERPDLVERVKEMIDIHFEERLKEKKYLFNNRYNNSTDPDEIFRRNYGDDRDIVLKVFKAMLDRTEKESND